MRPSFSTIRRPLSSPRNRNEEKELSLYNGEASIAGSSKTSLIAKAERWWTKGHKRKLSMDSRDRRPLFRRRRVLVLLVTLALVLFLILRKKSTLILEKAEVSKVWRWEIASGRFPSRRRSVWSEKELKGLLDNPGLPSWSEGVVSGKNGRKMGAVQGSGHARQYLRIPRPLSHRASSPNDNHATYPPRPVKGSAIDFDVVMDHCDFATGKYVRDCLHFLRANAGMDQSHRVDKRDLRHSFLSATTIYDIPDGGHPSSQELDILEFASKETHQLLSLNETVFTALASIQHRLELSSLPSKKLRHPTHPTADPACDPNHPRLFHIYWAGPFTDKPYMAAISFLYTQRLSLSHPISNILVEPDLCRPQLWFWINPGSASSRPDAHAELKMRKSLSNNQWSAPLLHERFTDVIQFRLWNSSEQLHAIPEMEGWEKMGFFKSGGVKYKPKQSKKVPPPDRRESQATTASTASKSFEGRPSEIGEEEGSRFADQPGPVNALPIDEDESTAIPAPSEVAEDDKLFNRVGSAAESDYDRLSVILSDMARFILTYRYGGVYLDADTIFLRDWEEIWGWHGAFAYRWSRLKFYNTAVLKMARGSALGSALIRTAFANGLDFHPMVVSRYMKELRMEELLLRLPDALFDSAWLNIENYQRDRPAFPVFKSFQDFFLPLNDTNAAPAALGFDGFFRGAFSYHFHNFWWLPFDPTRDYPDLGPRFPTTRETTATGLENQDLSWATVLKRTFEKYLRGQAPNAYGEYINWNVDEE
ncbi:hypothetical protein T439DRAFT_324862 [Meredithblackwellia eburnea MCA 4105]